MRINVIYEECNNAELLEKMKRIKTYEEYQELVESGEYYERECVDAFAAVNGGYMSEEHLFDELYSKFYEEFEWEVKGALEYKAYKEKEGKKDTALNVLLKKIRSQKNLGKVD